MIGFPNEFLGNFEAKDWFHDGNRIRERGKQFDDICSNKSKRFLKDFAYGKELI